MDLLELEVGEAAHGGWCVAREPAGRVVLVRHALPGERVLAQVTEATARFARADAVQILDAVAGPGRAAAARTPGRAAAAAATGSTPAWRRSGGSRRR